MITDLEPDILECEVKWALESSTTNKASGCDGIPVELFQILKDDAVKAQAGIKIAGRNVNNLRYSYDTTLRAESEEELKSLLMKEESEKVVLKLNIQKTKIMASGPITSWEIDGETVETVSDFFWAPKSLQMVAAAMKLKDACSLEGKL